MNEKVIENVTEYIDVMAAKLGVAAEHVYEVLVRQQFIDGITYLVMFSLFLLLTIFLGFATVRFFKLGEETDDRDKQELFAFITVCFGIATLILLFIAGFCLLFNVPGAVKQLINPEYYAIKEILDTIGGR